MDGLAVYSRAAVPNLLAPGTSFMEDNFSMDHGGGWRVGSGSNASDGERRGAADEASLAGPPLTSCCAARWEGDGDPCSKAGLGRLFL